MDIDDSDSFGEDVIESDCIEENLPLSMDIEQSFVYGSVDDVPEDSTEMDILNLLADYNGVSKILRTHIMKPNYHSE